MANDIDARRLDRMEEAMLELLLASLGAFEGHLSPDARQALQEIGSPPGADRPRRLLLAARGLRDQAIALGIPAARYDGAEWKSLGL